MKMPRTLRMAPLRRVAPFGSFESSSDSDGSQVHGERDPGRVGGEVEAPPLQRPRTDSQQAEMLAMKDSLYVINAPHVTLPNPLWRPRVICGMHYFPHWRVGPRARSLCHWAIALNPSDAPSHACATKDPT